MRCFQPVKLDEIIKDGPMKLSKENWVLVTSKKGDKVNTRVVTNGGFGMMWDRECVFIFLREPSLTREFVDEAGTFSLSFLNHKQYKGTKRYLQAVSGRDEDKIKAAKLTVGYDEDIPYIEEADNVVLCKTLFSERMDRDGIIPDEIVKEYYKKDDDHVFYIAEIKKILIR
ncbi:flavin reductase [Butyrivibrio sp. NC3005]|uniref:flavin reductase n=1 Tax=Butyrivibrio sp. NC3005 TaxID=1280685 RepID=UPI00041199CD|nr:flavin reductase [Butyrivibrio sp. NC3005]